MWQWVQDPRSFLLPGGNQARKIYQNLGDSCWISKEAVSIGSKQLSCTIFRSGGQAKSATEFWFLWSFSYSKVSDLKSPANHFNLCVGKPTDQFAMSQFQNPQSALQVRYEVQPSEIRWDVDVWCFRCYSRWCRRWCSSLGFIGPVPRLRVSTIPSSRHRL